MPNARRTSSLATLLLLCVFCTAQSINTAVGEAEVLQYDLYYNWKFLWVNAGSASMSVTQTVYRGLPAFRTRMLTRGSDKADRFFVLRDTLTSILTSDDMKPREYTKTDLEGEKYRRRHVWYTYAADGTCTVQQNYINPYGVSKWATETVAEPVYDMLSFLLRARSFDPTHWQENKEIDFLMTDGDGIEKQTLIYRGKQKITMHNSRSQYRCLVFSFLMQTQKGKQQEVATFYVTDDLNHLPIRIDLNLSFGSSKAYLSGYTGLRNPMEAKIK